MTSRKVILQRRGCAERALERHGVAVVILGCTELAMLIHAGDTPLPLHDTNRIHDRSETQGTQMSRTNELKLKRAYEPAAPEDGERYLVDRLWPRGVRKEVLCLTGWLKEVAPSDALRRWFGHDPERWDEFRRRYRSELRSQGAVLQSLRAALKRGPVTLVYSAHDQTHNQAVVLYELLLKPSSTSRKHLKSAPKPHER